MLRDMEKLKEWLAITKIPVGELADQIGAHPNSLHNWLAGRNEPTAVMIRRIHNRTNIPLDDLVPKDNAA